MKMNIKTRKKEFDDIEKTIAPGEYHTIIREPEEKKSGLPFN